MRNSSKDGAKEGNNFTLNLTRGSSVVSSTRRFHAVRFARLVYLPQREDWSKVRNVVLPYRPSAPSLAVHNS